MTRFITLQLATAAIVIAFPIAALAQSGQQRIPPSEPALPSVQAPSMNDRVAPGGLSSRQFEANDLKGKEVYDNSGNKVGEIDEVVPQQGQSREAVVSVGGILGIGAKKVLVPTTDIERMVDGRLVIAMSETQLEKLPEYERPRRSGPMPDGTQP